MVRSITTKRFFLLILIGFALTCVFAMLPHAAFAKVGYGPGTGASGAGGGFGYANRMVVRFDDDANNNNFRDNRRNWAIWDFYNNNQGGRGAADPNQRNNSGQLVNFSLRSLENACQGALDDAGPNSRVIGYAASLRDGQFPWPAAWLASPGSWQGLYDGARGDGAINGGLRNYDESLKSDIRWNVRNYNGTHGTYCVALNQNDIIVRGWKRSEEKGYDVASKSSSKPVEMPVCYAYYKDETQGTDGYPLKTSAVGSGAIQTAYGKLVNDFLLGRYGDFSPGKDIAAQQANVSKLQDAIKAACNQSDSQKTGVTMSSTQKNALAKGGIQLFTHFGKRATVSIPTPSSQWWWRESNHVTWRHGCIVGRDRGCQKTTNGESTNWWWNSGWHSLGTKRQTTVSGHGVRRTPYCMGDPSKKDNQGGGARTDWANYNGGCYSVIRDGMHPVANDKQSFVHISHYYVANILCDIKDFAAYRDRVSRFILSVNTDTSGGKYHGTIVSTASGDPNEVQLPRMTATLTNNLSDIDHYRAVSPNADAGAFATFKAAYLYPDRYDPAADPVYTKECPWDCVATKSGGSNGSSANVGSTGSDGKSYGNRLTVNDADGKQTGKVNNTANLVLFRNNVWNKIQPDVWYPVVKSEDGLSYGNAAAKTTTLVVNGDGTPWQFPSGGFITKINATGTGDDSVFGSSSASPAAAASPIAQRRFGGVRSATVSGQLSTLYVKSGWASDPNKPIKLAVKYEYDVSNSTSVPSSPTFNGADFVVTTNSEKLTATSDGKCYAQFGPDNGSAPDMVSETHDDTGAGSKNVVDATIDNKPYILLTFVRSTAE